MHILYLSSPGGGLETNVRVLAPALIKAGHQVSILYLDSSSQLPRNGQVCDGISIHHATYGNWHYYFDRATFGATGLSLVVRSFEAARALVRKVREIHGRRPIDLIEIPEVALPGQKLPGPYIVRLHSSAWMWRRMCEEPSPRSDSIEASFERKTLRRAAAITSPSHFVANYIQSVCRVNAPPIEIIPYPIDVDQFRPAAKDYARKSVLFVGRVEKRKGADILLRAVPKVLANRPRCEFLFVGQINEELRDLVKQAPAAVRFLTSKPRHELVELYQQASVVVVPSRWDNSPNVIYEAMACGTPVIATKVGGIPELVGDGRTGRLVPARVEHALAGAIIELLDDKNARARMGRRSREKAVALWQQEKVAARTIDLYEKVLRAS